MLRSLYVACCVAETDALMRPLLVQVPCLAARVSPAACPWRVRSRPCVPSPAVGVPGLGRATILSAETSAGLLTITIIASSCNLSGLPHDAGGGRLRLNQLTINGLIPPHTPMRCTGLLLGMAVDVAFALA